MATIRVGIVYQQVVTRLDIEADKLTIKELKEDAVEAFIDLLKSYGSGLPETTLAGYTAFIDFDTQRFTVRHDSPEEGLGRALPSGWERYEAHVYIPDPKKRKTGVYQLGDPPAEPPPGDPEEPKTKTDSLPTHLLGGAFVLERIRQVKARKKK